ncbi:3798_t:CDS:1, partial [Racocetra fulgida]
IDFIAELWDNVSNTTIQNCWNKTKILSNTSKANADTTNQHTKNDTLLENKEIEEIVAKLPDKSFYALKTIQAIQTYLQVINKPITMEEVLDNERIISILQAEENEELIGQKDEDEDEVPNSLVAAAEAYDAMQTIICYEEQESSKSNLSLEELEFLRKLLKEYKCIHEKSKKQTKITSFFNFQDLYSYSQDSSLQGLSSQDPYSQDLYSQDPYSQDLYSQDLYSQDSYSQDLYSQDSNSQDLDSESYSQDSYVQDSYMF